MEEETKKTKLMTRRDFLFTSVAITLGIPGCYSSDDKKNKQDAKQQNEPIDDIGKPEEEPSSGNVNKPTPEPEPVVPTKQSDHVLYYERQDAEYAKYRQAFNKRITHSPKIIAVCLDETGVQEAVKYANYYQLPIAIKSGGHSFEGYCLNNDGMVISLAKLNTKAYDEATERFVAGPGCKLGEVYQYLNTFGKLLPAGSCGGVGVAGLTLGGGYGFFSREHGLTCDHLTKVKMVDGEGNMHNSDDNPDLLWACRGGGNGNFGVITELTFKTVVAPKNFTSYVFKFYKLTPKKAEELAKMWFSAMETLPRSCYGSYILNGKTLTVLVTNTEEKESSALKIIVSKLNAKADKRASARKRPLLKALNAYKGRPDPLFFKNVSGGYYKGFDDIASVFQTIAAMIQKKQGMTTLLQINTLGGEIANEEKTDSAAYPHRQFGFLGELQVYYDRESQGAKAATKVQNIQQAFLKAGVTRHYRNYPDIDLPNWEQAYYGESYERLRGFKNRFDPNDHIQHPQSIKPS